MDRSTDSHATHDESSEWRPASPGGAIVRKEREPKEDGRYIIFYHFEEEQK